MNLHDLLKINQNASPEELRVIDILIGSEKYREGSEKNYKLANDLFEIYSDPKKTKALHQIIIHNVETPGLSKDILHILSDHNTSMKKNLEDVIGQLSPSLGMQIENNKDKKFGEFFNEIILDPLKNIKNLPKNLQYAAGLALGFASGATYLTTEGNPSQPEQTDIHKKAKEFYYESGENPMDAQIVISPKKVDLKEANNTDPSGDVIKIYGAEESIDASNKKVEENLNINSPKVAENNVKTEEKIPAKSRDIDDDYVENSDFARDTKFALKAFPEIKNFMNSNYVKGKSLTINDIRVGTHSGKGSGNTNDESQVRKYDDLIFSRLDYGKAYYEVAAEVLVGLEGFKKYAYRCSEGYTTIGIGNRLYSLNSGSRSDREKAEHLADVMGVNREQYNRIYSGSLAITEKQARAASEDFLLNEGVERLDAIIAKSLKGHDNLSRKHIDPKMLVLMLTIDYQSPAALKRGGDVIPNAIRTLANPDASYKEKKQAELDIISVYKDKTLIKEDVEKDMNRGAKLANRAEFCMQLIIGDSNKPIGKDEVAKNVSAIIRDHGTKDVHVLVVGKMPEKPNGENYAIIDVLRDENMKLSSNKKLNLYYVTENAKGVPMVIKLAQTADKNLFETYRFTKGEDKPVKGENVLVDKTQRIKISANTKIATQESIAQAVQKSVEKTLPSNEIQQLEQYRAFKASQTIQIG